MNKALIFAGGTGTRMKSNGIPKQFLEIFGKPTIIHTVEKFDESESVDEIVIVCLKEYIALMTQLLSKYNIKKVTAVIPGGATGFDSRLLGLEYLMGQFNADDIVLIHDGVRPMIDSDLINKCVECTRLNGNAIVTSKIAETVLYLGDSGIETLNRDNCRFARAPQTFYLRDIYELYNNAKKDGKIDLIDSASIAHYYGKKLYIVEGSENNIKITTHMDYFLVKGMMEAKEYTKYFSGDQL
mgnify:FL=1